MTQFDWHTLMISWNAHLVVHPDIEEYIDVTELQHQWLGFPGATEAQLVHLESRLATTLPPSYRAFLTYTNGWRFLTFTIENIYSTENVTWFIDRYPRIVQAWMSMPALDIPDSRYYVYDEYQREIDIRPAYLSSCLLISDITDAAMLLLNPCVVTGDGEWEAWLLASWLPGAHRYRSFWDLMQAEYQAFVTTRR